MKKITIDADDKRTGFTPAELRELLETTPDDATLKVLVGFRYQIKSVIILVDEWA